MSLIKKVNMPDKFSLSLLKKNAGKIMWKRNSNSRMHGLSEIGPSVPAFLVKLWKLVEDPECDLIYWSESGMSFIIVDQARFAREVLPQHYKHNNMASFIRQLNMYDFHKITSLDAGGLKSDKDEMEFAHQYFIRDHPYLLENIKRKLSNPKPGAVPAEKVSADTARNGSQSDIFSKLLSDVNVLKGKQESWDARLSAMKRENEALWRELAVFRQKHMKQEQIINRLIHFIVTIVQPSRKVPIPRRFPLMLNDIHQLKKIPKVNGSSGSSLSRGSPPGPTIHEIEGDVLINSNDIREPSGLGNGSFISTSFSDSASNIQVEDSEPEVLKNPVLPNTDASSKKGNASDWLEIVLTEDDMVTPLTPVDPAEVNPVVAAATLKHLETNNKITVPVTMKIPSIVTTDGKKRTIPEKKIIYLAEIQKPEKNIRKKLIKPQYPKNKGIIRLKNNASITESGDKSLEAATNNTPSISKILTIPTKTKASGKRKLSAPNSPSVSKIPNKRQNVEVKPAVEATSEHCSPFPTPNSLENLLKYNLFDLEANDSEDKASEKGQTSDDSFWKLESLYNGSLNVNELITDEDQDKSVEEATENLPVNDNEKISEINISDISGTDMELPKLTQKNDAKSSDSLVDFPPESLAVVCQSSSANEDLLRELSSHVDNVQGEIDYLKEVIKGEGYNLDMNNLLGYFNEDPLSYGLLPSAEEESKEKENDKGITGNEVITYGTPTNLMELVDLFGSTSTVQDWSNITAPTSPTVSELATPTSSPSPATLSKSGKLRKV